MKRLPLLLASGAALLMIASWPEKGFTPLIFLAWVPLIFLSDYFLLTRRKGLFVYAYLAFFLFNAAVTYWIWFATPAGAILAVTANAFLMAFTFWLWHKLRRRLPPSMGLALLPALWILFEKLHYLWDLEWPWLTMGNVFATKPQWVQWYEYTGVFGGTLWVMAVNLKIYALLRRRRRYLWADILVLLAVPLFWSYYLYKNYKIQGDHAKVLILQPNIDPWTEKFDRSNSESIRQLLEMAAPYADSADLIVAPETALARLTDKNRLYDAPFYRLLRRFQAEHPRASWLIGASLFNFVEPGSEIPPTANRSPQGRWYQLYNSALFITPDGQIRMYHKNILVPGAEKMPFRKVLGPLLGDIVLDLGGATGTHTPSPGPQVFQTPDGKIKVAPIICYESVFGDYVRRYVEKGANLLAVITNDGWWKKTGGYRQHFHYARLRAVETRRDVVRAANTGRSGHIDQRGDVIATLPYGTRGVLLTEVRLNEEKTFYVRYGDYIPRVALFTAVLLILYALGKKRVRL
ncbi:MAG: apolipoprotein N-acyltransferase [Chlorobi bacterium]|nr:apolipoprotein N-acyltransferase [Chlorobiota bacterium]